ncbi:MAG: hypothetical protein KC457_25870, partial [Myxococcales bacterium]|nr:hypothetical protein [Myxococcales bacterium]
RGGSGFLAPVVGRIKAFGRGSMLMVPAAAAAVLLFFTVRSGALDDMMGEEPVDGVHVDGGMTGTLKPGQRSAEQDFTVQVAPPRALPAGVALVSDDPQVSPASVVRYRDGEGRLFVDTQRAAPTAVPTGTRQVFRGHPYYLDRDGEGRIRVEFGVGPVYHSLVLHAVGSGAGAGSTLNVDEAEVAAVLAVAEALRNAHGQ